MGIVNVADETRAALIKGKAAEALRNSDLTEVFELAGVEYSTATAGTAMKAVLAEKLAEYTIKAMGEAKKRKMRLGAAAIIIAAKDRTAETPP